MKGIVRNPGMVIVFMIITCGVYTFYWIYKMSEEIQQYLGIEGKETSPTTELILSLVTCGLYSIYWIYKYSKLISEAQQRASIQVEDNAVLNLVLCLVGLSIVSIILMQSGINKVWETN